MWNRIGVKTAVIEPVQQVLRWDRIAVKTVAITPVSEPPPPISRWNRIGVKTALITPVVAPPAPPQGKIFGGRINRFGPTQLALGAPLKFAVMFEVTTTSLLEQINGWVITLALKLDTMSQVLNSTTIFGSNDNKIITFNFDLKKPMPNKTLTGTLVLTAYKGTFLGIGSAYFEVVEVKPITVTLPGAIPPDSDGKTPTGWIIGGIAAAIVAAVAIAGSKTRRR